MLGKIFAKLLPGRTSLQELRSIPGVSSAEEFQVILDRERGRSDRNSHGFSLVTFDVGESHRDAETARALCLTLRDRTRTTDEIGWVGKDRIAVLLPETYRSGANRFAELASQEFTKSYHQPAPMCTVRTYPENGNFHGHSESGRREDDLEGASLSGEEVQAMHHEQAGARRNESRYVDCPTEREIRELTARRMPLWKRTLDIVGALVALSFFAIPFVVICALIKLVSPGPIFFRQERVGFLGKRFSMWKFRTMHVNNSQQKSDHKEYYAKLIAAGDGGVPMKKKEDNPAIIPFGKIIRACSLDEIPQLFNVLRGEMSMVGPRPPIPYEVEEYRRWQADRFETVPGMTGLWQVSGKDKLTFNEMVRLDIRYARDIRLSKDLEILMRTPATVVGMAAESLLAKFNKEPMNENREAEAA